MDCSLSKSGARRPAGQQAAGNDIRCMGERFVESLKREDTWEENRKDYMKIVK